MSVEAHTNVAGDVSLGIRVDKAFVPFVTLSAAKVAQYVQRGHTLQERAEAGDDRSRDVLGTAFIEPSRSRASKSKSEGEA